MDCVVRNTHQQTVNAVRIVTLFPFAAHRFENHEFVSGLEVTRLLAGLS